MMFSLLLSFLFILSCIDALLSTLSLQSLNIRYSSYSYRGAAAIYNKTLYAWNGYECNVSNYSQCSASNQVSNTTNILHTLDISQLLLTSNMATRTINESLISSQWQTFPSIDPIYVRTSNGDTWPSMFTGTSTSSYTASSDYGWVIYPSGGDYRTKIALKFDLNRKQFVNTSQYSAYIPSTNRWSGACNANDATHVYAINGRGTDNADNTNNVWIYHIKNDTWIKGTKHPRTLFEPSCAVVNGILYSLGGQDGGATDTRITRIYGYDTAADTWLNSGNKVGDLLHARHHSISVTHPNDWIITVGGRGNDDLHSDMIELFDPVNGISYDTQLRYSLQNMYHATYKYDSNTHILFLWCGLYNPNNGYVSLHNEIKYIILSTYDAIFPTPSPTNIPSKAPTNIPSNSPTTNTYHPTSDPTIYPTINPTIFPTNMPTSTPTLNPSKGPIYVNYNELEGQITDYETTEFEEEKTGNIIVNVVQNDKWLVIAIVMVVFMILCLIGCVYWVYRRYNYAKMKKHIHVMNVNSDGNQATGTIGTQIEIELVNTCIESEKIEGTTANDTANVIPDEISDSDSIKDELYGQTTYTGGATTKGDYSDGNMDSPQNPRINSLHSEEMYSKQKGNDEATSHGNIDVIHENDHATNNENDSDSDDVGRMYDTENVLTTGR